MNMTDEEILNNELKFLENFGITYILVNDGTMAILFIDDIHVGYVMKDDNGDYETIIQSDKYQTNYSSTPNNNKYIFRKIEIKEKNKTIHLSNIQTKRDDFINYYIDNSNEGYGIEFKENRICCGKTSVYQNILVNGECYKGRCERVNLILEKFRKICPKLIDSYIDKYDSYGKKRLQKHFIMNN